MVEEYSEWCGYDDILEGLVKFSLYFNQLRIISQQNQEHWKRNHYLESFQGSVFAIIFMQWMDISQNIYFTLLGHKQA